MFFTINYSFAQKSEGIIYDYKKAKLTFTLGSKKLLAAVYLYRVPKNIGIGYSVFHKRYESFNLSYL